MEMLFRSVAAITPRFLWIGAIHDIIGQILAKKQEKKHTHVCGHNKTVKNLFKVERTSRQCDGYFGYLVTG